MKSDENSTVAEVLDKLSTPINNAQSMVKNLADDFYVNTLNKVVTSEQEGLSDEAALSKLGESLAKYITEYQKP